MALAVSLGALLYVPNVARPAALERIPDPIETALLAAMGRGVPAEWVLHTAWLETRLNEHLVGSAGECGTFQLNPAAFRVAVCELTPHERALIAVDLLAKYKRMYGVWSLVRLAYRSPVAAARKAGGSQYLVAVR